VSEPTNDRNSVRMLILSMLIFGTIGIFRRYIPVSSAFLAFARGILGGLFLLACMKAQKKQAREKLSRRAFLGLALTGGMIGINWMLLFEAYMHTTIAVATLCYYMQPTIVVLLSPLVFREKLTLRKGVCALISILGMVLVSGVMQDGGQGGDLQGILLGLGAAAFYAAVVILNKKIRVADAYQRTTVQLLSAGVIMVPYLLLTGGFSGLSLEPLQMILLLFVCIVHTGIAYALYFGSMTGVRVQSIAVLSYIDPVAALFISALILREPMSLWNIIGAVLIIGSAMISETENK